MNLRRDLVSSFFAGVIVGAVITKLRIAPILVEVLTVPVISLVRAISIFPNESLANLLLILPLLFFYWGLLGLIAGVLIRNVVHKVSGRPKDDGQNTP